MTQVQIKSVQCLSPTGLHQLAYKEWGDSSNPNTLICVHGLSRVSDDFDMLAAELASDYRVICPDIVGRGRSGRLLDPQYYQIPQYVSDVVTLIARLDVRDVYWLGTSMGGIIGMALASLPGNPVRKLIINDIGPVMDAVALARIAEYIGKDIQFDTFDEAWNYVRAISLSFGPHSDAQWRKLAADVMQQNAEGQWVFTYDPGIGVPFRSTSLQSAQADTQRLWAAYDAIRCPTLLIHGAESDLLSNQTVLEMSQRGPKATVAELRGVGHAPTFLHAEQIALAKNFLLG